ncbi:MAG TPA: hypothetical protein VGM41_11970 [Chitinophagaceae bacterium]|jgi:hypothetical protein
MSSATDSYNSHIEQLTRQLAALEEKNKQVAWGRFFMVVLIAMAAGWLHSISLVLTTLAILLLVALFIRLVIMAADYKQAIAHTNRMLTVNRLELAIAEGKYTHLPDGVLLAPATHDYAQDLDIFGRASLYQYINRTISQQGNSVLAQWLLQPADPYTILARQNAARELAPLYQWRQELEAHGLEQTITHGTEKNVTDWLKRENMLNQHPAWTLLRFAYPIITIAILVLYIAGPVTTKEFIFAYGLFFVISSRLRKYLAPHFSGLDKIVAEITVLGKSTLLIEKALFKSAYMQQLQKKLLVDDSFASHAIKELKNILDRLDDNLNLVLVLLLNPFLLWDLQLLFRLEKWRAINKTKARDWFSALGQAEAINSIANLHFNHPDWAFPTLDTEQHGTLEATDLGHPLIPAAKRVTSSFNTAGLAKLALVTGSNMAGKSTFLRSIGVNMVLAMTGAPVCATSMRVSPMRVVSTMRVADNLEESTSTFYAELKKLKYIIESVNRQEKVFLLLDEILRGTNSLDRHTGSRALVMQLIRQQATGILATHDLELAKLQSEYPLHIHNYHFDAQIAGEELYFDYKLKEGVCQSLNASLLMKKIGIEL